MEIRIYSEKSIALVGNTEPHKESIKILGGKWNPNLKDAQGNRYKAWIFSHKKRKSIEDWIADGCPVLRSSEEKSVEKKLKSTESQSSSFVPPELVADPQTLSQPKVITLAEWSTFVAERITLYEEIQQMKTDIAALRKNNEWIESQITSLEQRMYKSEAEPKKESKEEVETPDLIVP